VPESVLEPAPEPGSQDDFREYIVQPGDTISEIGRFHKVTVAAIIRASGITNPDRILVGQVLKIPPGE
jgi:LysM repeat protein